MDSCATILIFPLPYINVMQGKTISLKKQVRGWRSIHISLIFYNQYDEDSRLAVKHGTVEFLTTMRYIQKYLKPGDRVLEIGAGTGRYSHQLARQGIRCRCSGVG